MKKNNNQSNNMSGTVVQADSESIQTYLTSFNKEIEGGGSQEGNASTSAGAAGSSVQLTDAIYTIDGQKLSAGNIVIADSLGNVEGVQADGAGGYPTFMVNDQQYMLIVEQDENAADGGDGQTQTLVVTTEGTEAEQVIEAAAATTGASTSGSFTTPVTTRSKRNLRNQSTKRIKQEVIEEERENDISVYDFNDHRGHNITVETTGTEEDQGSPHDASGMMTEEEDGEETDEDYKTPVVPKGRGRPKGSTESKKISVKSASSSIGHHSSGGSLHVCTYCNYTSNKRYLLSRHLKSHSEDRPHKCGICERGFKVSLVWSLVLANL